MITFQTVGTEKECKQLWERYSPKKHLWDLWEFRYPFHTDNFEFNFLLCYDSDELMAILPLVFDRNARMYTYFGDTFPERNKVLVTDPDYKEYGYDLFYECPYYTSIYYVDKDEAEWFEEFEAGEKRYFLDLSKFSTFDEYVDTFTKKHRKNLKYDLKKLEEKEIAEHHNRVSDFEHLKQFNKERFGKDSDYNDERFVASMKHLLDISNKKNMLDMISIEIDSQVVAVGFGVVYNGIYYVLNSGRDLSVPNIGKLLISKQITRAIEKNCSEIDFLATEAAWKDLWNLQSEETLEFYS